jgi:hypothetical protein
VGWVVCVCVWVCGGVGVCVCVCVLIVKGYNIALLIKTLLLPAVTNKQIIINHSSSCVVWGCSVAGFVVTAVQLQRLQFLNYVIHCFGPYYRPHPIYLMSRNI